MTVTSPFNWTDIVLLYTLISRCVTLIYPTSGDWTSTTTSTYSAASSTTASTLPTRFLDGWMTGRWNFFRFILASFFASLSFLDRRDGGWKVWRSSWSSFLHWSWFTWLTGKYWDRVQHTEWQWYKNKHKIYNTLTLLPMIPKIHVC